jgi:hypothetical protein
MNATNTTQNPTDFPGVIYGNAAFLPSYTVWAVLNVALVLWRRNYQPVKSRSPLLMLLSLFSSYILILLLGLRYSIGRLIFPCLVFLTTFYLFAPGMFMPTLIRCWRLLLVYTSNRLKLNLPAQQMNENEKKRIKVLNVLSSSAFLMIVVLLLYVFHTIVMFVSLGILAGATPNDIFFKFSSGCLMSLPILGLVVAQILGYLVGMVILVIISIVTKTKDAWGVRIEVIIATVNVSFWSAAYLVLNVYPGYQDVQEYTFPAGSCIYCALVIDNILTVFIPCCRSFWTRNNFMLLTPNDTSRDSRLFNILSNDAFRHEFKKYGMQSFCPESISKL